MSGAVLSESHETLGGWPLPLSLTELPITTLGSTGQPTDSVSRPESRAASDGRSEEFAAKRPNVLSRRPKAHIGCFEGDVGGMPLPFRPAIESYEGPV